MWQLWNMVQENKSAVITTCCASLIRASAIRILFKISKDIGARSASKIGWAVAALLFGRTNHWCARRERRCLPADVSRGWYQNLHTLRDSVGFINKATMPIGRDGRNRPSLFPFCTATGRNAHARRLHITRTPVSAASCSSHRNLSARMPIGARKKSVLPPYQSDDKRLKA